ncbi:MAG: Histidine ammonia-lyase [bacterium ADurb.Bin478]|nr:MAG: Histidine ammonia-lyase [bacterium ADurb.Bin478]
MKKDPTKIVLDGFSLDLDSLSAVSRGQAEVQVAPAAWERIRASRRCVEAFVHQGKVVYGINTGFGKLASVHIPDSELNALQRNLVLSHACGVGAAVPQEIARVIVLLKINTLCTGYSGVRPEVVECLLQLLNHDVIPVLPCKGSVGASGDLAPLAHLTLVLLGLGQAWVHGRPMDGAAALASAGLQPLELQAKEGLSLLNGTQVLTAYAAMALLAGERLAKLADIAGAISVESLLNSKTAFDERIQKARGHSGQVKVAENLRRLLADSEIMDSHRQCGKVQDAYSSRCMPQVHGAVRQALAFAHELVAVELNSCSDNPLVFADQQEVLSGGNFHGQPLSLASDTLAIAMTQLANISERRLENLMDPVQSGLPPFLAPESGTNSGFMIAQVTAAALVSENKVLSHPASVDSIPTSANQEDFVSMAAHAGRKALEVTENSETVLAIELLAGCQATDFRKDLKPGAGTGAAYRLIREQIPVMEQDRLMYQDIEQMTQLMRNGRLLAAVERAVGSL